jgi:hypothetical protein
MSMKNSSDTIGNRTRGLTACSLVSQPTAPPAACPLCLNIQISNFIKLRPVGGELFHGKCRTYRRTDTKKLIATIHNFANLAKMIVLVYQKLEKLKGQTTAQRPQNMSVAMNNIKHNFGVIFK